MFLKFDAKADERNFFPVFAVFLFTFLFFISISNNSVAARNTKNTSFGYMVKLEGKPVSEVRAEKMDKLDRLNEEWEAQPPLWKWTFGLIITRFKEFLVNLEKSKEMNSQRKELENVHERFSRELERYLKRKKPPNWKKILKSKEHFKTATNAVYLGVEKINITEIEKIPGVKKVYPAPIYHTTLDDTISSLEVPSVWNGAKPLTRGYTGKGVKIAILDSGIDYTHPDFGECSRKQFLNGNCEKIVGGYDFVNKDSNSMDNNGHGTHVAGISAAKGDYNNNGEWDKGEIWGVAPDAQIYNYKVLDEKGETSMNVVIEALSRSLDPNQDGDYSDHADVVSMSFGGAGDPENEIINRLVRNGVVVVVAAGNSGPWGKVDCRDGEFADGRLDSVCSPGKSKKAITVGAVNSNNEIAGFSSRGPVIMKGKHLGQIAKSYLKPDLVAPGRRICSALSHTVNDHLYCVDKKHIMMSGTSMAAPFVSGTAALLIEKHPDWAPEEIKYILTKTAEDLGYSMFKQGYGLLDVKKALGRGNIRKIGNKISEDLLILETSGEVNGITKIKGKIRYDNVKKYTLQIKNKDRSEWETVIEEKNPERGPFSVEFDTRDFPDGFYILKLSIEDKNGNTLSTTSIIEIANIKLYLEKRAVKPEYLHNNYLEIFGTVNVKNFEKYEIEWNRVKDEKVLEGPKTENLKLTKGGKVKINQGFLGKLNLKELKNDLKSKQLLRIKLEVTKEDGGSLQKIKEVNLTYNFPRAKFTYKPDYGKGIIKFDASESKDPDGLDWIDEYEWDFNNDGKTDKKGETVIYKIKSPKDIPVKLTVVDLDGLEDSIKKTIEVKFQKEKKPHPKFTFSPKKPITGQSVDFDASNSYDPDGKIKKYRWYVEKAGGEVVSIGKGEKLSHTFDESGKYKILLIVTDDSKIKSRTSKQLNVEKNCIGSKGLGCKASPERNIYWGENECLRDSLQIGCNPKNPDDYSFICKSEECVKIEPSIKNYEIRPYQSTSFSKSIKIEGYCPEKLRGRCLIMCSLKDPHYKKITVASWDISGSQSIIYTCKKSGTYTIKKCGVYTGFPQNKGFGDSISVKKTFRCELPNIPDQIKAPIYFENKGNLYYLELENNKLRRAKDLFSKKLIGSSDIDQDGGQEIFYVNYDNKIEFWEDGKTKTTNIEAVKPVGSITNIGDKWLLPYTGQQGNMKIAKFENSFKPEIVTTPINLNKENSLIGGIGDIDGDGNQEIVYTTTNNNLVFANINGEVEHSYDRKLYRKKGSSLGSRLSEVRDMDGDGKGEFFVRKGGNWNLYVYGESRSKKLLEDIWDVGGIGDIDGDGRNELIFVDLQNNLKYLELTENWNIKEIVDINVNALSPGDIYNSVDEIEKMDELHLAFHPTCREGKKIAFQIGKDLEEELLIEEFRMRDKVKCEYKENTNVPKEFPFWSRKPEENYLTISLVKSDSNRILYVKDDEYSRKLALNLVKYFRENGFDASPEGVRCPGFTNLCENYYGGTPVSIRINFKGNGETLVRSTKGGLIEYSKGLKKTK